MDGWIGMCGESKGFLCVGLVAGLFVCVGRRKTLPRGSEGSLFGHFNRRHAGVEGLV